MATRICFVTPHIYGYFNPEYGYTGGGAERQIYLLSKALRDNFDVHVVVGDYGQPKTEHRDGVTLHRAYPLHPRKNIFQPAKHLILLGKAMRRADADIYVHRGDPRNAAFVFLLTRLLRRNYVYNLANDANIVDRPKQLSPPISRLYRRAIHNSEALIAQTDHQRKLLNDTYGVDASVVPNGYPTAIDPPPFEDREYFLWVGSFNEEQKRPHLVLELAEELTDHQFRLVGPVDEDATYQNQIQQRATSLANVTFVGTVPPTEIHEEYREAIALVNTSAYEGFPNTFLEAWRQATPVVSLAIDPRRYLPFDAEENGYAENDIQKLSELCKRLAACAEQWNTYSTRSRELFEASLSIETVADQYASVLRRI